MTVETGQMSRAAHASRTVRPALVGNACLQPRSAMGTPTAQVLLLRNPILVGGSHLDSRLTGNPSHRPIL